MICTEKDGWVTQRTISGVTKSIPYWTAKLSSGLVVYSDYDRPNYEQRNAWIRLKEYCELNNVYPTEVTINFRKISKVVAKMEDGIYLSEGIYYAPGLRKNHKLFVTGSVKNNIAKLTEWIVPEMIENRIKERNVTTDRLIIWKNLKKNQQRHND